MRKDSDSQEMSGEACAGDDSEKKCENEAMYFIYMSLKK